MKNLFKEKQTAIDRQHEWFSCYSFNTGTEHTSTVLVCVILYYNSRLSFEPKFNGDKPWWTHLDRFDKGSFMIIASFNSPNCSKYSRRVSKKNKQREVKDKRYYTKKCWKYENLKSCTVIGTNSLLPNIDD